MNFNKKYWKILIIIIILIFIVYLFFFKNEKEISKESSFDKKPVSKKLKELPSSIQQKVAQGMKSRKLLKDNEQPNPEQIFGCYGGRTSACESGWALNCPIWGVDTHMWCYSKKDVQNYGWN